MIVSLGSSPLVSFDFVDYLEDRLGMTQLTFQEPPTPITDGWESYIYRFCLRTRDELPDPFKGPLVLRAYSGSEGWPRLKHEFEVQRHLRKLGYPVAQPLLCEEDCGLFGGPFMVMRAIEGTTLLEWMFRHPLRILDGPAKLARQHARLHALPTAGFKAPRGDFLDRHLSDMANLIAEYRLQGLRPGLDWLDALRPATSEPPSILHLDFHPLNYMTKNGECQGILDWGETDLGDRHADVATSLILIWTAPVATESPWDRVKAIPGRLMLYRRYRRAYRRLLGLDDSRLRYYLAWAALRRLCKYGLWLRAGPGATGCKATSMQYLSSERIGILEQAFRTPTGVAVTLR
jgi:aminoglycoside phosphotransferase (APT) family kinase protein